MNIVSVLTADLLAYWREFDARVCTFTAPEEQAAGITPAIGIVTQPREPADLGVPCVRVAWRPDAVDLALLSAGGTIWLSTWGGLPPHMLEVQAPTDSAGRRRTIVEDNEDGTVTATFLPAGMTVVVAKPYDEFGARPSEIAEIVEKMTVIPDSLEEEDGDGR